MAEAGRQMLLNQQTLRKLNCNIYPESIGVTLMPRSGWFNRAHSSVANGFAQ